MTNAVQVIDEKESQDDEEDEEEEEEVSCPAFSNYSLFWHKDKRLNFFILCPLITLVCPCQVP
jgi:hypothetical protein